MKFLATISALLACGVLSACAPGPQTLRVSDNDGGAGHRAAGPFEEVKPPPGTNVVASQTPEPDPDNLMCLARALYFEARSQRDLEVTAVAHVVLNRVAHPDFPDTICEVVREGGPTRPCQFGWYCDGRSNEMANTRQAARMVGIAREAIAGESEDPTHGANMFHSARVLPFWTRSAQGGMVIGAHRFWRLEDR